jgi:hypothetical protein
MFHRGLHHIGQAFLFLHPENKTTQNPFFIFIILARIIHYKPRLFYKNKKGVLTAFLFVSIYATSDHQRRKKQTEKRGFLWCFLPCFFCTLRTVRTPVSTTRQQGFDRQERDFGTKPRSCRPVAGIGIVGITRDEDEGRRAR